MKKTEMLKELTAKVEMIAIQRKIKLHDQDKKDLVFHLACFKLDGRSETFIDTLARKFVGMCA